METRLRDPRKTKENILRAAEEEFASKGIYGTRVDAIAGKAGINKRMIYEYFGNKEELYRTVLARAYSRLSKHEVVLLSNKASAVEAIKQIIRLYFEFLNENPTYVNLIMWENLNKGRYIDSIDFREIKHPAFELLKKVLEKGKHENIFRKDLDNDQLIISLLTFSFSYYSNRYTMSRLLSIKLDTAENIKKRIDYITDMFLAYICI